MEILEAAKPEGQPSLLWHPACKIFRGAFAHVRSVSHESSVEYRVRSLKAAVHWSRFFALDLQLAVRPQLGRVLVEHPFCFTCCGARAGL